MVQIQGRVLPASKLAYGTEERMTTDPRNGIWDMRNLQFVISKAMDLWGNFDNHPAAAKKGTAYGAIPHTTTVPYHRMSSQEMQQAIDNTRGHEVLIFRLKKILKLFQYIPSVRNLNAFLSFQTV